MVLDDVAQELYGLSPEKFTEVRNARAKEIIASGDRALAAEVRRLPKPTVAAWLANSLVRTRGPDVDALIALGPELREAQRGRARQDMRRLAERRREVIGELVGVASRRAAEAGHSMGPQVQRQLEETLEAAVADEDSAVALRAGRLSNPLAFIGFGGDNTPTPRASTEVQGAKKGQRATKRDTSGDPSRVGASDEKGRAARPDGQKVAPDAASEKRHREAERALAEAARALSKAQRGMESAQGSVQEARRRHGEASERHRRATKELRDLDRDRHASNQQLEKALQSCADAEQQVKDAARELKRRQRDLTSNSGETHGRRRPN